MWRPRRGDDDASALQLQPSAGLPVRDAGAPLISFSFRNQSHAVCRLSGFPSLTLLDAHGNPLPTVQSDQDAVFVRGEGLGAAFPLNPQQSATFGVNWTACARDRVTGARIALPGIARRFALPVGSRRHPFDPCGARLSVSNLYPAL